MLGTIFTIKTKLFIFIVSSSKLFFRHGFALLYDCRRFSLRDRHNLHEAKEERLASKKVSLRI